MNVSHAPSIDAAAMGWTSTEFAENTASRPGKVFPLVTLALLAALLAFSRDCYAVDVIAAQRMSLIYISEPTRPY